MQLGAITVTLMPTVPTPRARSTARVTQDTLVMASRAQVHTAPCFAAALIVDVGVLLLL